MPEIKPATQYKEFRIGDLITSFNNGYWIITNIYRRFFSADDPDWMRKGAAVGEEFNAMIEYVPFLSRHMNPFKCRAKTCDAGYCRRVTQNRLDRMLEHYTEGIMKLKAKVTETGQDPPKHLEDVSFLTGLDDIPTTTVDQIRKM